MPQPVSGAPREANEAATLAVERLKQIAPGPIDPSNAPGVLGVVLEAIKFKHGALLRYDSETQSLTMLAHEGLAPPAIDAIRLVRRGVSGVWDMPLHAVLQRRVYIIDKPKENPFVPMLLNGADQNVLTNAAVLPLFAAGSVTGALLLVGSGKRAIHESDILALREPAKILGIGLRPAPKTGARLGPGPSATPAPAVATSSEPVRDDGARDRALLTAKVRELEAVVESLRRSADSGGTASADLERKVADAARERDRYKSEASLHEIALRNLRSEYDLLRDQSSSEAERTRKLALDLARVREDLTAALDAGRRTNEELDRRDRLQNELGQRIGHLERQLGQASDQVRSLETHRQDLDARLSAASRDGEGLRGNLRSREDLVTELRGERERLTASLQTAASRYQAAEDSIAQIRESSELRQSELQADIEELRSRAEAAERERDQLSAGLAGRSEILREIERETEQYKLELARESERRRVAEETSSSVIHDAATLREEVERAQAELQLERADADRARSEAHTLTTTLEALRRGARAELAELRGETTVLTQRLDAAEAARGELADELKRVRPELDSLRSNQSALHGEATSRGEAARQLERDKVDLAKRLEEATDSSRTLGRERDALAARVATLEETTRNLLREGNVHREQRANQEQELQTLRGQLDARGGELDGLRRELVEQRTASERASAELATLHDRARDGATRASTLDHELASLREELRNAQSRGSELTAELARRARTSDELQAALTEARQHHLQAESARRTLEAERGELLGRVSQTEQALAGASADLADKKREVDFAGVLRATLTKSETARRAAEDAAQRLQDELEAERRSAELLRAQSDSERENAGELAARLEEIERRLAETEQAGDEAHARAAELTEARAVAQDTADSLTAELGRRAAELNAAQARLEASQRAVADREAAIEAGRSRGSELEERLRSVSQELEVARRQSTLTQDERARQVHELELRFDEVARRAERLAADIKVVEAERERLRQTVQDFDLERVQAIEQQREAAARTAAFEASAKRTGSEAERLAAEVASATDRLAALEADVRQRENESARWQGVAEKLQSNLEERDREITALRAMPKAAPGAPPATERLAPKGPAARVGDAPSGPLPLKSAITPTAKPSGPARTVPAEPEKRTVLVVDDPGKTLDAFLQTCQGGGYEAQGLANGAAPAEAPGYLAINLLSGKGGLDALVKSRRDEMLSGSRLMLYASKPGSGKGVIFPNVECLIRPFEEAQFAQALTTILGNGKRVTIIGEELDSVLRLNAWATAKGCSVSSAGDPKQGTEILDIVKPDLIVFDFSRLTGEGATLIVKARRTQRLEALPILLVLPAGGQTPSAQFFMKRLLALAEETPLDLAQISRRLGPPKA